MSMVFDVNAETVWNPALKVGQVFVGYVETLEKVFQTPSGFSFMASDFVDIDIDGLTRFHSVLTAYLSRTNNDVMQDQVRPVLAIVTVLLRRGGSPPTNDPADVGYGFADYLAHVDATIGTL